MDLMASLASGEPLDETRHDITDVSQLKSLPAMQYAFRGEGNCSYSLCPSIYRKHNDGRRPELGRAMNNFAAMLKNASDYCFANDSGRQNLAIELFVGAAQHYRLSTPMMDWTTDPCVAVAFAADYDPKEHLSVVYALPMFRAVQHNATFYLPPPFVERLYLQRGFFIETKEKKDDEALQESCIRILFKEDKAFKVIRNGAEIADLMKPLPALDALALHAKELAKNGTQLINDDMKTPEEADRILTDEWNKIGGIPDFLQPDMGEQHAEAWREYILEMIERISHLRTVCGQLLLCPWSIKIDH
ncbi:MAG: FRG domain-containing protein [Candidatus Obscuribacter sp.]|nr:FRG domain-containing protein [Candidatus Obscuribacter sp.]MBK9276732.1 FRG domain-containing protein [Candidatus Obscuribacter sp.]